MSQKVDCRKFSPNVFNKQKCASCFRNKDCHDFVALESNKQENRRVLRCGFLFVAPDWDFSVPINRTKKWQRRWFTLYSDGELTYSMDDHPEIMPQGVVDVTCVTEVTWAEEVTGHQHSVSLRSSDRVTFIKGTSRDESRWWIEALKQFVNTVKKFQRSGALSPSRESSFSCVPGVISSSRAVPFPGSGRNDLLDSPGGFLVSNPHGNYGMNQSVRVPAEKEDFCTASSRISAKQGEFCPRNEHVVVPTQKNAGGSVLSLASFSPSPSDKTHSADTSLELGTFSRRNQKRQDPEGVENVLSTDKGSLLSSVSISGCSERKHYSGLPQKRGWLMRYTDKQEWCRQWAILCDMKLMFYKHSASTVTTDTPQKLICNIDLSHAVSVASIESGPYYAFSVTFSDNTTIMLATTTGSIRAKWIMSLSNVINNNKNTQTSQCSSAPSTVWSSSKHNGSTARDQVDSRPLCLPAERDTTTPSTNDKCTNSSTVIYRGRCNTSASTDSLSHAIASYEIAAGRLFTSNKDVYGDQRVGEKSYTSVYEDTLSQVRSLRTRRKLDREDEATPIKEMSRRAVSEQRCDVVNNNPNNNSKRIKHLELLVQTKNTEIKSLRDELTSLKQTARDSVRSDKSDLYKLKDLVRDLRSLLSDRNAEIERLRSSSVGNGGVSPEANHDLTDSDGSDECDTTGSQPAKSTNQQETSSSDNRLDRAVSEIRSLQKQLNEADETYHRSHVQCSQLRRFIQTREEEHKAEVALFAARLEDLTSKLCQSEKQLRAVKSRSSRATSSTEPPPSPGQSAMPSNSDSVSRLRRQRSLSLRSRSDSQSNLTAADWRELNAKLARLEQRVEGGGEAVQQQPQHRYEESTRASRLRRKSLDGSRQNEDCLRVALRIDALSRRLAESERKDQDGGGSNISASKSNPSDDVTSGCHQLIARACHLLRAKFEQLQTAEAGSWYSRHVQKLVYISLILNYIKRINDTHKQNVSSAPTEREFLLAETHRRSELLEKLAVTSWTTDNESENTGDVIELQSVSHCDVTIKSAPGYISNRPIARISTVEGILERLTNVICSANHPIEHSVKIPAATANNNNNNNNNSDGTHDITHCSTASSNSVTHSTSTCSISTADVDHTLGRDTGSHSEQSQDKPTSSTSTANSHGPTEEVRSCQRSNVSLIDQKQGCEESLAALEQRREQIRLTVNVYRRGAVKHLARALFSRHPPSTPSSEHSVIWSDLSKLWLERAEKSLTTDRVDCELACLLRNHVTLSLEQLQFDRNHLALFSASYSQSVLDKTYDSVVDRVRNEVETLLSNVRSEYELLSNTTESNQTPELTNKISSESDSKPLSYSAGIGDGLLSTGCENWVDSLVADIVCVITHYAMFECSLQRLAELNHVDSGGSFINACDFTGGHPLDLSLPEKSPLALLEAQLLINSAIDNCSVDFQHYGLALPSGVSLDDFCLRTRHSVASARAECQTKLQQASADHRKQLAALQKELDSARRARLRSKSVDKSRRRVSDVSEMLRSRHAHSLGVKDDSISLPSTPCQQCAQLLLKMHSLEQEKATQLESMKSSQKNSLESLQKAMTTEVDKVTESYQIEKQQLCEQVSSLRQRLLSLETEYQQQQQQTQQEGGMGRRDEFEETIRRRYQTEIDQLRSLCEKGLVAMEKSNKRVVAELVAKHGREMELLQQEKQRALAEETQATLAALDALRKAHRSEVQREVAKFKEEFASKMQPAVVNADKFHRQRACEMGEVRAQVLDMSQKYSDKCMEVAVLNERVVALTHQLDLLRTAPLPTKDTCRDLKPNSLENGGRCESSKSSILQQSDRAEPPLLESRLARAFRETQQLKQQLYDTQKKEADMETVCRQLCVFLRTGEQLKSEDVVALRDRLEHIVLSSPRFIADCIRPDNENLSKLNDGADDSDIEARRLNHNRSKDLVRSPSCPRLFTPLAKTGSGVVSPLLGMVASRKMVFEQGGSKNPSRPADHRKHRTHT